MCTDDRTSQSGSSQDRPSDPPESVEDRELDFELDQSFPASDPPSIIRPRPASDTQVPEDGSSLPEPIREGDVARGR